MLAVRVTLYSEVLLLAGAFLNGKGVKEFFLMKRVSRVFFFFLRGGLAGSAYNVFPGFNQKKGRGGGIWGYFWESYDREARLRLLYGTPEICGALEEARLCERVQYRPFSLCAGVWACW